jgi:hypothetical protein
MCTSSVNSAVEARRLQGASDLLQVLVVQLLEMLSLLFRQLVIGSCLLLVQVRMEILGQEVWRLDQF